jgi:hypothetical protein
MARLACVAAVVAALLVPAPALADVKELPVRPTLPTADTPYLRPNTNPFAVTVIADRTIALPQA